MTIEAETTQVDETVGTEIPGEGAPETNQPSEVETRARAMGWVDKEQFRGNPDDWRDAEAFVKRGEEELPVLRERNRDMARRNADLEARIAKQEREFNERALRQENMARLALQQQRQNLEEQYESAKRAAVEVGDMGRYDQLNRDQRQAINQFDTNVQQAWAPPQPQNNQQQGQSGPPPEHQAKVDAWGAENPWFFADQGLANYALTVHQNLQRTKPGMTLDENLAEVTRTVRQQFPEKFGRGGGGVPSVEGGNGLSGGTKRSRGFSDLPAEAKRAAEEFVRAGAFKTRDEYAKSYWSMESA